MTSTEKLAKFLLVGIYLAIAWFIFKYFGNIIGYIVLSLVVALLAKPLMTLLQKIRIKGKSAPRGVLAFISIIVIVGVLWGLTASLTPVITNLIANLATIGAETDLTAIGTQLSGVNANLQEIFHLKPDFRIEDVAVKEMSSILSVDLFGSMLGTIASTVASVCIGVFAVIFISFYLIKDDTITLRFISAITPDKMTQNIEKTFNDCEYLLSRYFVGLLIEMACIGTIDFLGLWTCAGLDVQTALGIGFLAGILNIIPYIGPLIGGVLGTLAALAMKYCTLTVPPTSAGFWTFLIIVICVFIAARLVDDFVLQPLIYSTSVKAHPLEIFIVLLIGGTIGGMLGMLVAIPAYTIVRVLAINFFPDTKLVEYMTGK